MRLPEGLVRFASSDPDYAPFGYGWLRGLTLARFGVVAVVCLLIEARGALVIFEELSSSRAWAEAALDAIMFVLEGSAERFLMTVPVVVLVTVVDNLCADARTPVRVACLAGALVASAFFYAVAAVLLLTPAEYFARHPLRVFLIHFFRIISWGGVLTSALFFLARERRMAAAAQRANLDRIDLDRQMAEAHLQMLQAQIEPHFLFNSLATIEGLYRQDPSEGRRVIRDMSEYLRGALPEMREQDSSLRRELALSEAYLRVQQVRMGDRLKVEIDVPPRLREAAVPPMMLPTLVENAIKHGLAPVLKGGVVRIRAEEEGERLRLIVSDDGAGFRQTSGAGVGLANTRARLASLFGSDASLRVGANAAGGVTASIELPLRVVQRVRSAA
jgi:two-component sensor histidine kinase